jgi:threonine/homoserine efflux transporter RhtA
MSSDRIRESVAAVMAIVGLGVVSYLATVKGSNEAVGAIIALLSAAVAWYLRGRISPPTP